MFDLTDHWSFPFFLSFIPWCLHVDSLFVRPFGLWFHLTFRSAISCSDSRRSRPTLSLPFSVRLTFVWSTSCFFILFFRLAVYYVIWNANLFVFISKYHEHYWRCLIELCSCVVVINSSRRSELSPGGIFWLVEENCSWLKLFLYSFLFHFIVLLMKTSRI